jgi:type IV secretory pathway VirJ component
MRRVLARNALTLALALPAAGLAGEPSETLTVPGLGSVALYAPKGPPEQVVLFVSGDGGWSLGVVAMAERLRDLGALVAGIDIRAFLKSLEASKGCAYPAGSLEELSRTVQLHRQLPAYRRPILVGYSSGATLVYAALAAAPPETFAGGISLGFCPDLEIHNAPCRQRGLAFKNKAKGVGYDLAPFGGLTVPWMVLQGEADQVCAPVVTRAFVAATGFSRLFSLPKVGHGFSVRANWEPQFIEAYRSIASAPAAEEPAHGSITGIEDLGLVEVPASGGADRGAMAVILTGDGGWADIDKSLAAGLAAAGVPAVGWSSLRYYWTPRTPEAAAHDLARIIEHYSAAWKKERVVLVGYSFGADVLPFLVNRLPTPALARIRSVNLLGLSDTAAFEFHVASWLGGGGDVRHPTVPEVTRLTVPVTCVHGTDEKDSACLALKGPGVRVVPLGSGHHFGGYYERLVDLILGPR